MSIDLKSIEAVPKLQLLEDKRSLSSYLEFRGKTGLDLIGA
jgi:hypothetical protein